MRTLLTRSTLALLVTLSSVQAENNPSRADSFDHYAQQIRHGLRQTVNPDDAQAMLRELKALLPDNDAARDSEYRRIYCLESFHSDAAAGVKYATEGFEAAQQSRDLAASAEFLYCKALHQQTVNGPGEALDSLQGALKLAREANDKRLIAHIQSERASLYSVSGEQAKAIRDFLEAQALFKELDLQRPAEANVFNMAGAYRRLGDFDRALEYLEQSRNIAEHDSNLDMLTRVYLQFGFLHIERQDPKQAVAAFNQALKTANQQQSINNRGSAYMGLAHALNDAGNYREALKALQNARAQFQLLADPSNEPMLALQEARALAGLGQHQKALVEFERAERAAKRENNLRHLALLYPARSHSLQALGFLREALADEQDFIRIHETLDSRAKLQQTELLRYQFDVARRDADNERLLAEQALRQQELHSLKDVRRWQGLALLTGSLLLLLLGFLALRQILRARALQTMAMTDELTGVANRRRILLFAEQSIKRAVTDGQTLSVVSLDIDFFKRINDSLGHGAGDRVLVRVARACQALLRQFDLLGRTGGEEFLVILPRTGRQQAIMVAERLRCAVAALDLKDIAPDLHITISLGVAEWQAQDAPLKNLLARADAGLYRAKANGRNRVEAE